MAARLSCTAPSVAVAVGNGVGGSGNGVGGSARNTANGVGGTAPNVGGVCRRATSRALFALLCIAADFRLHIVTRSPGLK